MNEIVIRRACLNDAEKLLEIYAPYVTGTSITFEYDVPSVSQFHKRIEDTLIKYPYLVAEKNGEVTGYAYASAFKSRAAYDWAVETSIYVKQGGHGGGVGKALYEELEKLLKKQNIINLNACITYPNPDSIGFHEHFGYIKVAHFTKCGYKLGKWHDMIWMEKMIGEHTEKPAEFIPFSKLKID